MLTESTPFVKAASQTEYAAQGPGPRSSQRALTDRCSRNNVDREATYSCIASHYTGALAFPDAFSLELVGILDRLLEPSAGQRICTSQAFRSNPWLQVWSVGQG